MLTSDLLIPIGYIAKTHGIKGELNVVFDSFFYSDDLKFAVCEIDSIFVPFVIESSRGNSSTNRLVKFKDIDNAIQAKEFVGKTFYALKRELENFPEYREILDNDENFYLSDLIGYSLLDPAGKRLGEIIGFNDDTQNFLLEIALNNGSEVYIPFVPEWITEFNHDPKSLKIDLPKGLLELNRNGNF